MERKDFVEEYIRTKHLSNIISLERIERNGTKFIIVLASMVWYACKLYRIRPVTLYNQYIYCKIALKNILESVKTIKVVTDETTVYLDLEEISNK